MEHVITHLVNCYNVFIQVSKSTKLDLLLYSICNNNIFFTNYKYMDLFHNCLGSNDQIVTI